MAALESSSSPARPSPATQLHDLVVVNEQSGVEWRVANATIDGGRIVILSAVEPPRRLLSSTSATFTIRAVDGGERVRRFAGVTLDRAATLPQRQYVFG